MAKVRDSSGKYIFRKNHRGEKSYLYECGMCGWRWYSKWNSRRCPNCRQPNKNKPRNKIRRKLDG